MGLRPLAVVPRSASLCGVCRPSIPCNVLTTYQREYPFGWLGIIADANPVSEELIYCYHGRGFALFSMRSPTMLASDLDDDRFWGERLFCVGPHHAQNRLVRRAIAHDLDEPERDVVDTVDRMQGQERDAN